MSKTKIDSQAAQSILKILPVCLQELDMSDNPQIDDKAIQVLADKILDCPDVRKFKILRLGNCGITCSGINIICKGLTFSESIECIDLNRNQISEKGAESLHDLLIVNTSLKILDLSWNPLEWDGGLKIAMAMMRNKHLKVLNISQCKIGRLDERRVKDILKQEAALE